MHTGWGLHWPWSVADCPLNHFPAGHDAWGAHANPFFRPLHEPLRYWLALHFRLVHAVHTPCCVGPASFKYLSVEQAGWFVHVYPLLLPLHEPPRYCPLAQFWFEHTVHAVLDVPAQPPVL